MEINSHNGRLTIDLPATLDLSAAAELRDLLIDAAARDTAADTVLNCGAVDRISTAAIQVILAAAAAMRLGARRLELAEVTVPIANGFHNLGLASDLDQLLDT